MPLAGFGFDSGFSFKVFKSFEPGDIRPSTPSLKSCYCGQILLELSMKFPDDFKNLLWSHDISRIDPDRDKTLIIVNTINYGDLEHWKWIRDYYGKEEVKKVLTRIPAGQMRDRVRPLVAIIFQIDEFNHAPRSVN